MTGYVSDNEKSDLLKNADVFLFPTFYEGFGLPVLEAMACGTPVVAADNSSLSEVAGDAGLLFDPNSGQKLADALLEILNNEKLRDSLQKKGLERVKNFSWEKCARETLEWIKE